MPVSQCLIGKRFGQSLVIKRIEKNKYGAWVWECLCDCGKKFRRTSAHLKMRVSCGCLALKNHARARGRIPHGMTRFPEHKIWIGIRARCSERGDVSGRYYARGIRICPEWTNNFPAFFEAVGPRPTLAHSIDRIKNDKGYEPGNVRWATKEEQANNKTNNVTIEFNGKSQTLSQWAREFGVSVDLLSRKTKAGVPIHLALKRRPPQIKLTSAMGMSLTIPEWARLIGVTRESAYRLNREGRLQLEIDQLPYGSKPPELGYAVESESM